MTDYLTPILDDLFLDCSYGFRPGRSVDEAVLAVCRFRDDGQRWVLDTDIQDCFGSIDLQLLMGQIENVVRSAFVVRLIEQWLHTAVESQKGRTAGVSQGGVISPLLANLYLHRFDEMTLAALPRSRLVRFADDFVLLSRSETEAVWSLDVTRRSLENLRLNLNAQKTRVTHFDEGFSFLGVTFKENLCSRNRNHSDYTTSDEG